MTKITECGSNYEEKILRKDHDKHHIRANRKKNLSTQTLKRLFLYCLIRKDLLDLILLYTLYIFK